MEGRLAGVGTGTLPDHCKEGGRRPGLPSITTLTLFSSPLISLYSHTLSASFNHPPLPASHPPLVPLLSSYKSISFSPLPPAVLSSLPRGFSCLPPLPISLSTLFFIPCHSSTSFHSWESSGSRKVRGGQAGEKEKSKRQHGNVKMSE